MSPMRRGDSDPGSLVADLQLIRSAAALEALALGRPQIDLDHLLLGLIAAGGPSAALLAGAGVDLTRARRVVGGEPGPGPGEPDGRVGRSGRKAVRAADRPAAMRLPLSGRARALLGDLPFRGDDRMLLLALLDDEEGRIGRMLERLGVDVQELRAQAAAGPPRPLVAATDGSGPSLVVPCATLPVGMRWMDAEHVQVVPVPVELVWALVSDPSRRPEWDLTCSATSITSDGHELLVRPSGHPDDQSVVQLVPGRAIAWRRPARADAETHQVIQITLAPGTTGTIVSLRRSWPASGSWRLLRPFLIRMVRTQLRAQAQGITQAVA